ncbi:hypothetical protein HNQ08_004336 [Deinococcus humi]|uniref:Uncharacterized protein n=1 Tax=Deinococcus humi TaxID=662880 RepID=A0A7W8JYC0_9DEIO|nr:hypothetical protein [Deinococcus humi]
MSMVLDKILQRHCDRGAAVAFFRWLLGEYGVPVNV